MLNWVEEYSRLTPEAFGQVNSLIFRGQTSHKLGQIKDAEKNIELKVMIIKNNTIIRTKKSDLYQFLVADDSACAYANFFDETGKMLQEGDILYLSGVYSSFFKDSLLIYQGGFSTVKRIGNFYLKVNLTFNISQLPYKCKDTIDNKMIEKSKQLGQ